MKLFKKDKKKIYDTFYQLKSESLIKIKNKGGQIYISLTKEGEKRAGKYQVDDLKIKEPKKWDGQFRVVIFDIPEKKKQARDILREKLEKLGFYQLQKSVFVYPFECQEEIELITRVYEIEPFVYFMRVNYIDNQRKIKEPRIPTCHY